MALDQDELQDHGRGTFTPYHHFLTAFAALAEMEAQLGPEGAAAATARYAPDVETMAAVVALHPNKTERELAGLSDLSRGRAQRALAILLLQNRISTHVDEKKTARLRPTRV